MSFMDIAPYAVLAVSSIGSLMVMAQSISLSRAVARTEGQPAYAKRVLRLGIACAVLGALQLVSIPILYFQSLESLVPALLAAAWPAALYLMLNLVPTQTDSYTRADA